MPVRRATGIMPGPEFVLHLGKKQFACFVVNILGLPTPVQGPETKKASGSVSPWSVTVSHRLAYLSACRARDVWKAWLLVTATCLVDHGMWSRIHRAAERKRAEAEAEQEKLRARKAGCERLHIEGDPFAPTRAWLRKREHKIDFEGKVGSSEILGSIQGGDFICKSSDVTPKDSNRYLAHVNSRAHQKALGMSMRIKRSTPEEVQEALKNAVKERHARRQRKSMPMTTLKERVEKEGREMQAESC